MSIAASEPPSSTSDQPSFQEAFLAYQEGTSSFVQNLTPEQAVKLTSYQLLEALSKRYGFEKLQLALNPDNSIPSPRQGEPNGEWLQRSRMVGINVRTVRNFFNVVKYSLTLPSCHDTIHFLPIWEPGVVGSLYGITSWHINPEFFSQELYEILPALATVDKQLKVVINLLHLMGYSVGMDVIPHTDRFSEMVIGFPRYFEWVKQKNGKILNHREDIWQEVEQEIYSYLTLNGTADGSDLPLYEELFDESLTKVDEDTRMQLLFGYVHDYGGRLKRRVAIMRHVIGCGYETLPMTMAPPYRSLHINPEEFTLDDEEYRWYQYEFDAPQAMSRVFGPLTRYRAYHSKNNNQEWELDFSRPQTELWDYVSSKYLQCQREFQFDFMRGDMTHVQMQPEGVPPQPGEYYDLLAYIKRRIQKQGAAHFAFFAESFIGAPDYMGYGDEIAHLEAIGAEVTLGDLQSTVVGSELFMTRFRQYLDVAYTRAFTPCFTVMTADKDDPRFDEFYQTGNTIRYFMALFLPELPSYMGAGFETRNLHVVRGFNEEYSKLYVFQISDPAEADKYTTGPYLWGRNQEQFQKINKMRTWAENILPELKGQVTQWLSYPDPTLSTRYVAWMVADYVFVATMEARKQTRHVTLPIDATAKGLVLLFSSMGRTEEQIVGNHLFTTLAPLEGEECRIYKLTNK